MLTAYIYKNPTFARCSNGGISERCDRVTIVNVSGPVDKPTSDAPPVILETHVHGTVLRMVPAYFDEAARAWRKVPGSVMAGGAFVGGGDSRLSAACERLLGHRFYGAIALHDRTESPALTREVTL